MSIAVTARVIAHTSGLDALLTRLQPTAVEAVIADFAGRIADEARTLVPVDTGALRDSIQVHLSGLAAAIAAGEGLPDARAVYQELGFHTRDGRFVQNAYLWPAFERHKDDFLAAIAALIKG